MTDRGRRWSVRVRVRHFLGAWGEEPFTDTVDARSCWDHDGMKAASLVQGTIRGENPDAECSVLEFYEIDDAGVRVPPTAAELAEARIVAGAFGDR